jgi:hypothetical protein
MDYTTIIRSGIGIVAMSIVVLFLFIQSKGSDKIPWQLNTYLRIFSLVTFVYLLTMGIIVSVPEISDTKMKVLTDCSALAGDLTKTLIGAIIGVVSVSVAGDKKINSGEIIPPGVEEHNNNG